MNQLLWEHYGEFDFEMVKTVISFLSPEVTPGYWNDYLIPDEPMSAQVEGVICAADLQAKLFATKGGYWSDGWLHLTLPAYV